ncbi:GIY-YIG nuclease family protein [Nostoc sp. DedQUE07]|uniref:GIY-YIG nuclease family protein n=1 Tax=Nostoc sp. DedQUE07 TaxID=3075392 RepID=UPI00391A51D1
MESGYIYIFSNPSYKDNLFKIGYTTKDPKARAKKLYTTGVLAPFTILYAEDVDNPLEIEQKIHKKLADFRFFKEREGFLIPIQEAISKIQEVTQRAIYEKGTNILDTNMAFRWLCQPDDFIFLVRYTTFADELNINPIVDFWSCKAGDQVLITNIPGEDKIYLDEDDYITLPLKKSKNDHDINPINGIIHELCEIHPGDRIVWLAKSKENANVNEEYYVHTILNCRTSATLSGFSNANKIVYIDGIPLDFGCDLSLTEIPDSLSKIFQKCLIKIKSEWKNDIFNSPIDEVGKLLNELLRMSNECSQGIDSSNRKVYSGVNKKRVKQIGERLNQIGGLHLMILVTRQIPEYDRRPLEFAWSGIGEWMD